MAGIRQDSKAFGSDAVKSVIFVALVATAVVNVIMAVILSTVGGEFKKSVRASIISALLANVWALGALLLLFFPIDTWGGLGRYLFLIAPLFIMYWLLVFAEDYPFGGKTLSRVARKLVLLLCFSTSIIVFFGASQLIVSSTQSGALYEPNFGIVTYSIYAAYFALFSYLFSRTFLRKIRKMTIERQRQAKYAYGGTLISSFVAFVTNLILPVVGTVSLIWVGPASSFIYAASFLYAMRRYRLFEIRQFAARGIFYLLTIVLLVVIYALIVGYLYRTVNNLTNTPLNIDLFYSGMTAVAILAFAPLKNVFDRMTKHIFFKNEYVIQYVIDELGTVLLRSNIRSEIIQDVGKVLRKTLLTDDATIITIDEDTEASHELTKFIGHTRDEAIVSIDDNIINQQDIRWMRAHGYDVVARISLKDKALGWITLGPKRSGNPYSEKDFTLLDIASDEIAIAMEGAAQYEQIQAFNLTLQEKIKAATSELRTSNEKLKDSNKKLRELDETKDEFISMASHQLRTPLTSVKGYISMLLEGDMGELKPAQRQVLEEAFGSSQRMVYLIGDFLNLSRLRTGKFVIERAPVSLPLIIEQEISQLREAAKLKNIVLRYESPAEFPKLMLDETKIRQVMMNFIDNAIYYSKPSGGKINISLVKHSNHVTFRVIDNGIGVPKGERSKLFTKFYRAENARRARPDGTGVGLFMAKKVVIAHGGAIVFESKEDQGSTFGMRLPLDEANTVLSK